MRILSSSPSLLPVTLLPKSTEIMGAFFEVSLLTIDFPGPFVRSKLIVKVKANERHLLSDLDSDALTLFLGRQNCNVCFIIINVNTSMTYRKRLLRIISILINYFTVYLVATWEKLQLSRHLQKTTLLARQN